MADVIELQESKMMPYHYSTKKKRKSCQPYKCGDEKITIVAHLYVRRADFLIDTAILNYESLVNSKQFEVKRLSLSLK